LFAAMVAAKCENDYLLTPSDIQGSLYSFDTEDQFTNVLDGDWESWWRSSDANAWLHFNFSEEVTVEWIYIQRWADDATWVEINDGNTTLEKAYFGDTSEWHSSITLRYDDVYTDNLNFHFDCTWATAKQYYVAISRLEVYGCYNTSAPTAYPTEDPTEVPSIFPTVPPTLPPVTTLFSPSSAPSVSPTVVNPLPYPSAAPSVSPTKSPSIKTVAPTKSPTPSPTVTHMPSVVPSSSPSLYPTTTLWPSTLPSFSPTETPTETPISFVHADSGFEVKIRVMEFFMILILLLCGVVIFLLLRIRKLRKRIRLQMLPKQENNIRVLEGQVSHRSDGICMAEGETRTGMTVDRIG